MVKNRTMFETCLARGSESRAKDSDEGTNMHPCLPHVCKTNSFDTDSFPSRHCARVYYAPIRLVAGNLHPYIYRCSPSILCNPFHRSLLLQTAIINLDIMEAHEILGIPAEASEERVRIAFKALVCSLFIQYST